MFRETAPKQENKITPSNSGPMEKVFSTRQELFDADLTGVTVLHCSKIDDLESLPSLPEGLEVLYCKNNPKLDLTGVAWPSSLKEIYACGRPPRTRFSGLPEDLEKIYCCRGNVEFESLPTNLIELYANECQLTSLPTLPEGLKRLYANNNKLSSLPELPQGLMKLYVSENELTELPTLPDSVVELYCTDNKLATLPELPSSLEELYVDDNELTSLPELPAKLRELYCSNNKIEVMPLLPDGIEEVHATNNRGELHMNKTPKYYAKAA
ncbi:hypothetical protein A2780_00040 [Candidatus Daviesbacteria bacterium RIFCSPHIGHO2_01_FULL_41_45]|nr:MAG: hypothetical protein A2780_00040 [Candidatus Daviesbacteria bacterium RIFCSPHIGHO2_01_FULL_41_45]OGH81535.1 MAG: hypothetical protein A3F93_00635 [Candidatus Magasanikbacteria bacterium RIFCSPLOWO2_12_FULL_34_7]OGN22860.1 MAG: hypothetical protein A2915_01070 [Candidatus Yanofskybacteria bacterium RIFCSPLOWO2_01_FULL_41_34]